MFGVARSTACEIFQECAYAIVVKLMKKFVRIPTEDEFQEISDGFRECWGFPMCVGAIDATHIPIIAPQVHRNDYFNRKSFYSILMQAVVDNKYLFYDVFVGFPGRAHDARVFINSDLYSLGVNNKLFPDNTDVISGVTVPYCLVGDAAYPLHSWLMKLYPENRNATDGQIYFNYRLSRARMVVECAFG